MSSYFTNGHPAPPPRRNRRNSIAGLITPARPRSLGIYSTSPNSTNNPYTATTPSFNATSYSSIPSYSLGYSSPYVNYNAGYSTPYNNYGLMSPSSYSPSPSVTAGLSVMLNSLNLSKPSYPLSYSANRDKTRENGTRKSRQLSRNGSYGRDRSQSKSSRTGSTSDMGSRSISLNSLESQGYVSGSEQGSGTRRLVENNSTPLIRDENGEIDYKKLWEQSQAENERLRDKLRKQDDELRDTKTTLEKISTVTSKNSLSELEKREKRAMERKLSEMEEELKQLQKLKAENERLRAENRALTRVVSKLTNTAGK